MVVVGRCGKFCESHGGAYEGVEIIMKIPYIKIPIADVYAYLAPLDDTSKGQILLCRK